MSLIKLLADVSEICKSALFEMSLRRCMRRLKDASEMHPCRLGHVKIPENVLIKQQKKHFSNTKNVHFSNTNTCIFPKQKCTFFMHFSNKKFTIYKNEKKIENKQPTIDSEVFKAFSIHKQKTVEIFCRMRNIHLIFSQHRSRATLFAYYRELIPETLHLSIFTFTVKI